MRNVPCWIGILLLAWALSPGDVAAEVFTAGNSGDYATIQEAIEASLSNPGDDEVRIAAGVYPESLEVITGGPADLLTISGGWDAQFIGNSDPTHESIVDGESGSRVLGADLSGSTRLAISRLTFRNGAASEGAGLSVGVSGSAALTITDCVIEDNHAESDRLQGGGVLAFLNENATLTLRRTSILRNSATCTGAIDCVGGGAYFQGGSNASLLLDAVVVEDNAVSNPGGSAASGGVRVTFFDDARVEIIDSSFYNNTVSGDSSDGTALGLAVLSSGEKLLRRLRAGGNAVSPSASTFLSQVSVAHDGSASAVISDTLIEPSVTSGLTMSLSGDQSPVIRASNLTVVDQLDFGIRVRNFNDVGEASVSNSIVVGSGTDLSLFGTVDLQANIVGSHAEFANAAGGDYSLIGSSPAVDAGVNMPPGGLSGTDLLGNARVVGPAVDIGAIELPDAIFSGDFEAGSSATQ